MAVSPQADANGDGVVTNAEVAAAIANLADADGNGKVSYVEAIVALDVPGSGFWSISQKFLVDRTVPTAADVLGSFDFAPADGNVGHGEIAAALFDALDELERHLEGRRYLVGDALTEADVRLAVTLFRFDLVYVQHFKTDRRRIIDYPNLWRFTRRIYQLEGVAQTVRFDHIREHYFRSHPSINPHAIIPLGPELDWWEPL